MARRPDSAIDEVRDLPASEVATVLLETYAVNDSMNQLLLAHLDPRAWRAELAGAGRGGRTIAAIFAHLHNCRQCG